MSGSPAPTGGRDSALVGSGPSVAIWRNEWLPASETFVRDHVRSLTAFQPITVGYTRLSGGLDVQPDFAPYTQALGSRVRRHLLGLRGHRKALLRLLEDRNVCLLHAHFGHGAIAAAGWAKALRVPLVVTLHGHDATQMTSGARHRRYVHALREALNDADAVLAVSEYIKARAVGLGVAASKITVSHLGVSLDQEPRSLVPAQERNGIAFVGRLVEKKGTKDLLLAASRLPERLRNYPINIVGDGPLRQELVETSRKLGVPAVFHGRLSTSEVSTLLSRAAIVCVPSRAAMDGDTEGLPISLLEAGRAGAAVLATRHAGIPEFVSHGLNGILVDEADITGLSVWLESLIDDPCLRQRLGDAARARVETHHDLQLQAARLERLYLDILSSRKGVGVGGQPQ